MTRLPIRLRLTAAFAFAMVIVLAAACLFVYVHLRTDIDDAVTGSLETRAAAAVVLAERGDHLAPDDSGVLSETDESFAQLLGPDGRVLSAVGAVDAPALDGAALRRAARAPVIAERSLPGLDDTTRVLARPVDGRRGLRIVAVGQSLQDRNESLSALIGSFLIAGPLAVLAASIVGYGLATSSLAPVEAMRRRASAISLTGGEERLPLPAAHDEIRRLGETLNAMLDRLRRSFERERRFVADASHELRTPVAIVKTELEGALRTGDYGPEVGHALVAAVEECDRLAQLADDLLVLARAGDGRLPTRPEPLRAWDLLEGTRERFADRAAQHDRAVRIDAAPDICVLADPLRLRQALGNLLDNALRHGAGDILLAAHRAEGSVELDVGDAGDGFTEGIGDRAFERFTRGDEARSREGAGLGLAIVKAIAEAHGGEVGIVDRGTGAAATIVRIRLPDRTPPMGPPSIFAPAPADEEPRSQAPLM